MSDSNSKLAIDGGSPAVADGPPTWPLEDTQVQQALAAVYKSGDWGRYHGPHCQMLCDALSEYFTLSSVQLCCSGTFAVELALRSLQVESGDEVIMAGYDFSANIRSIQAIGATPVLVDVDRKTWCLDEQQLTDAISSKTKAILVSHLHGGLAAMSSICEIAQKHQLKIIEDICQSPGAAIDGRLVGTWGDVAVMSFGGSKLLTAGRGGAMLTDDPLLAQRAKIFCQRGNDAFPMSELQAAVLLPQLQILDQQNRTRADNVGLLRALMDQFKIFQPLVNRHETSIEECFYKLPWALHQLQPEVTREQIIAATKAEGVALDVGFRGFVTRNHRRCRKVGDLSNSQYLSENTVVLHHPVLLQSTEMIRQVAAGLEKIDRAFCQQ